ncbi:MAG: hypothetical protein H6742_05670 [Alphaproteobacteria bacterium]|nr:hypothetical protein [Alphaproteobacteria bacterium]
MGRTRGRVFVVRGDIRRLAVDAWLLPSDGEGRVEPSWVAWPAGAAEQLAPSEPFPHWTRQARRIRRLQGWPDGLPRAWAVHVELDPSVPSSWFIEAAADFVGAAAHDLKEHPPARGLVDGRASGGRPLVAVPVGVAGIGAAHGDRARKGAGSLVKALMPELHEAARDHGVDVVIVAHSDESWVLAQAARRQTMAGVELPDALRDALGPALDAARQGRLWVAAGPELALATGLPSLDARLDDVLDRMGLPDARVATLRRLPAESRLAAVSDHLGGATRLGEVLSQPLQRAHHGLVHGLLAGLPARRLVQWTEDDQLEQALSASGRPADALVDGPGRPGAVGLLRLHGSMHAPADLGRALLDPGRHRGRLATLAALLQADAGEHPHLLVLGHAPDADLVRLLNLAIPRLGGDGRRPVCTVLAGDQDPTLPRLWGRRLGWIAPATGPDGLHRLTLRCLDWLADGAATSQRLLDPGSRVLLDPADQALARAVDAFLAELPASARAGHGWQALARWLAAHGHPGTRG